MDLLPTPSARLTTKIRSRSASAPLKFLTLNEYTVVPETTPSVGSPVGVFVYPKPVRLRIGRWFMRAPRAPKSFESHADAVRIVRKRRRTSPAIGRNGGT